MTFESWVAEHWHNHATGGHRVPFPIVAALGLAGETGEAVELLKKHYRDGKHPGEDLKLELGDVLHYLTVIALSYGWTIRDLTDANIAKLTARYAK